MNPSIQNNKRIVYYRDLPAVMELKAFITKLDAEYDVNSEDKENTFGIIHPDKALVSELYESNIYYRLYGHSSESNHLPQYIQVPLAQSENLFALRQKAIDEIKQNLPVKPKLSDWSKIKVDYRRDILDTELEKQGFANSKCDMRSVVYVDDYAFCIEYATLSANAKPYFSTTYKGWQNQEELDQASLAYQFYKKWNVLHGIEMTLLEYEEMLEDVKELEKYYKQ